MTKNLKLSFIAIFQLAVATSFGQACEPIAQSVLDTNNVRCRIFNSADKWWDLAGSAKYEVPKGSGKNSIFAGSIWIGGYDQNGTLHVAGETYRQTANDHWPGPVQKNSCVISVDPSVCTNYQHIWNFKKAEIATFVSSGTSTNDILTYPANGNAAAGELPFLAPFFDVNVNGIYEPLSGDYPLMDINNNIADSVEQLFGDQCLYWIYNDTAGSHTETGGVPLGVEVHAQAFAYTSTDPALNNATFYRYKIINRSCNNYDSVFIGHWIDADLGKYDDDYVGCDVGRDLGFCYNGDPVDDLPDGYGNFPPAVGSMILQGPTADVNDGIDNDHDGITDEAGEQNTMTRFMTYNNDFSVTGNTQTYDDYYQYMNGSWKDAVRWTWGGGGYNPGSSDYTYFMFPWGTDPNHPYWNETTAGNTPFDRRFLMSSGPFSLDADECTCITYAVLWAQDSTGNNLTSVDTLKAYADRIKNMFSFTDCPCSGATNTIEPNDKTVVSVFPNPMNNSCIVSVNGSKADNLTLSLITIDGRTVEQQNSATGQFVIEKKNKPAGIYFYSVKIGNKVLANGKLVIN